MIVASRNRKKIESASNATGAVKRVRRADLQLITILAPRIEEQSVRVLDVTVGDDTPVWRRGLNKSPVELETKMVAALQRELDKSGLYLDKLPDGSVALHTDTARREGDEVCNVTGLLYDSVAGLTTFLSHGGNKVLVDRLLEIRGLGLADDEAGSLHMAITGVARYVRHYLGVRRGGPNAVLVVQTGKGCGDGLVKCIVQTRNGVGIAAKSPVVINYGNEYDVSVATTAAASDEGDAKRFRGVLDEYFAKQGAWSATSGTSAGNSEPAAAMATTAKPSSATSQKAGTEVQTGEAAAGSVAGSISGVDATAAKSAAKARAAAKATTPVTTPTPMGSTASSSGADETAKRPQPPLALPPAKMAKTGEIELGTITSPISASLLLVTGKGQLIVRATVEGSKKVPPRTVMAKCKDGKVQKQGSGGGPAWSFKSSITTVVVNPTGQLVKLAEFCEAASCKSVARHKGPVTGSLAVQGDVCAFEATADEWKTAIRLATELTQVSVNFLVKKKADSDEAIPAGVALSIAKQIIVKAGEDFVLQ